MDQMIKQQEDLNQQTTDQTDQKWNQFFQKTYWNKCTKLGESWKWNDEDIDQNTMDQMIKQREDFDQNQEVRIVNIRLTNSRFLKTVERPELSYRVSHSKVGKVILL